AYLLKYDSLYGKCDAEIEVDGDDMKVDGKRVSVYQIADPEDLDWKKDGVDVVVEATGKFTSLAEADDHLTAGARKVLITAPCKDEAVPNIVMGVNDRDYDPAKYQVFSNASCTTNCLAP